MIRLYFVSQVTNEGSGDYQKTPFVDYIVIPRINKLEKDKNYLDELVKPPEDRLNLKEVLYLPHLLFILLCKCSQIMLSRNI